MERFDILAMFDEFENLSRWPAEICAEVVASGALVSFATIFTGPTSSIATTSLATRARSTRLAADDDDISSVIR